MFRQDLKPLRAMIILACSRSIYRLRLPIGDLANCNRYAEEIARNIRNERGLHQLYFKTRQVQRPPNITHCGNIFLVNDFASSKSDLIFYLTSFAKFLAS